MEMKYLMDKNKLKEYSPITYGLERTFYYLQYLSIANLLFGTRVKANKQFNTDNDKESITKKRGTNIEYYILAWVFLVLPICICFSNSENRLFKIASLCFAIYRLGEILVASINMNLFDAIRVEKGSHYVSSILRTIILSLINYFEIFMLYSIIYNFQINLLVGANGYHDTIYFSFITQLTIGYGDILPKGILKLVSMTQGIFGFLFGILVLSRFISIISTPNSVQEG